MSNRHKTTFYDFIVALFLVVFIFGPLGCVLSNAAEGTVTNKSWGIAIAWIIVFGGAFLYARWRCSSKRLSYWRGLIWSVAAASTGWWSSIVLMVPSFLLVLFSSFAIACFNDISRKPSAAPQQFEKLIKFLYNNRMRQ